MADSPRRIAKRIVSLVPSLTESLFCLGLGDRIVGITDWCIHPSDRVSGLPRVGGTKNPSVRQILELEPDLVIANREENRKQTVVALESVVRPVEEAVRAAEEQRPARGLPVFCPIWKKPWMAVGGDTYASSLLELCGGANVFADRDDRRYPIVEIEQIVAAAPEVILLPSEPYDFGPRDVLELAALTLPAARNGRIHLIDGTLVSWYGPRIEPAIATIRTLFFD